MWKEVFLLFLYNKHSIIGLHCYQYLFVHLFQFLLLVIKLVVVVHCNVAMNFKVPNCCNLTGNIFLMSKNLYQVCAYIIQ